MSELESDDSKPTITFGRIAGWVIVGGVGVFLIASGIIGILTKVQ